MTSVATAPGPAVSAGPGPAPRKPSRAGNRRKWTEIVIFTGPALFLFLGFVILPVILAAVYSFFNLPSAFQWKDLNPEHFIGFKNYTRALTTPDTYIGPSDRRLSGHSGRSESGPSRPHLHRHCDCSWDPHPLPRSCPRS